MRALTGICLGALILCAPAFYNGAPLVYSDTSTYLSSGFALETPFDRPIGYGLLLRLTSLNGISLWFSVLAQGLLISYLLWVLMGWLLRSASISRHLSLNLLLAVGTSLAWTTSLLMPDLFTPAMVLCFIVLITAPLGKADRIALYILYAIACITHLSHPLFGILLVTVAGIVRILLPERVRPDLSGRALLIILVLSASSWLTMGSALSKSRPIFFMGAMAEHGVLSRYLEEHCPSELRLCSFRGVLPMPGYAFVWDQAGPVQQLGGFSSCRDEFQAIIRNTLSEPRYWLLHLNASVRATFQQLTRYAIGDGLGPFGSGTELAERMAAHVPLSHPTHLTARQQRNDLSALDAMKSVHHVVVVLSLVLVAILFWSVASFRMVITTCTLLLAVLLNAWICGTFSGAIDRLGAKMSWLLPLLALTLVIQRFGRSRCSSTVPTRDPQAPFLGNNMPL